MSTALLDRQSIQERQGGPLEYVSPSRLNCWIACPRKFAFRYIDGIRSPTTASLFVGKAVHSGLEVFYRHRQLGLAVEPADVIKRLLASWDQAVDEENMTFDTPAEEQAIQKQVVDLVKAYLAYMPTDEPRPLAVETSVEALLVDPETGENFGIPLLGIMDLVLDDTAGPLICDFKTSARSAQPLEITHEIQLSSYAYLFRQCAEQKEAGLEIRSIIKTKAPKVEFHRYPARTDAHFTRLFSLIREYLDALDAGRFNYRPSFGCSMCDFRSQCQRWAG
jgi:putative RecB family exonuclease